MADAPVVHIGENSPQEVAFKLLRMVMAAENKGISDANREYILDGYAECLNATNGFRAVKSR